MALCHSHRLRKIAVILASLFLIYVLGGFFGVPPLVRHILQTRISSDLHRPVEAGTISFNPFTLWLQISNLRVAERGKSHKSFIDIGYFGAQASWRSIWYLAPVLNHFVVKHPVIRLTQYANGHYNCSDLIESRAKAATHTSRQRFAIANIQVSNGQVHLDDRKLHTRHNITRLRLDIPFIANFPADIDVFVQPLLQMRLDGDLIRISGHTMPFSSQQESVLHLAVHNLDLTHYAAYVASIVPLKLLGGMLSAHFTVEFLNLYSRPLMRIAGAVSLSGFDVHNKTGAPMLSLRRGHAVLTNIQPLTGVFRLGKITLDGLRMHVTESAAGKSNLAFFKIHRKPSATGAPHQQIEYSLKSLHVSGGSVRYTKYVGQTARTLDVQNLDLSLSNLSSSGHKPPATFEAAAAVSDGSISAKGTIDPRRGPFTADVRLSQLDLPTLSNFWSLPTATKVKSGTLSAALQCSGNIARRRFALVAGPGSITIKHLQLTTSNSKHVPIRLTDLRVQIGHVDAVTDKASIREVSADGLALRMRRRADGALSLASMIRRTAAVDPASGPAAQTKATASAHAGRAASAPSWHYNIARVVVANSRIHFEDDTAAKPVKLTIAPIKLSLENITNNLSNPLPFTVSAAFGGGGRLHANGTVTPRPLAADFHINSNRLDIAALSPYVRRRLNVTVKSALLTTNGRVRVKRGKTGLATRYSGMASVTNLRLLGRVTHQHFFSWRSLSAKGMKVRLGGGVPFVHVRQLALRDFSGRVILNRYAQLNLFSVISRPHAPPHPITRPAKYREPKRVHPIPADIAIHQFEVSGGRLYYTDLFIKPNYSAHISHLHGTVGGFSTRSKKAASVKLQGKINDVSPVEIDGTVNPLVPDPSLDIRARADGITLPPLTPFSAKYTGYPINSGTLSLKVHYRLQHRHLAAQNHMTIYSLTFGKKVQNHSILNLPIQFAVALLENSQGVIRLDIPVSGSLSNPHFSISGTILAALEDLVTKAVSAPFTLLENLFGGGSGTRNLGYVDFLPGSAKLTAKDRKKLNVLAKALRNRPRLQLRAAGRAVPALDREALRQHKFDRLLAKQKANDLDISLRAAKVKPGSSGYDKYLKMAYDAASFSKPTDFFGFTKSLPPKRMKHLLLAHIHITKQDLKRLADRRATAVRRYLADKKVDPARLFVLPPRIQVKPKNPTSRMIRTSLALT